MHALTNSAAPIRSSCHIMPALCVAPERELKLMQVLAAYCSEYDCVNDMRNLCAAQARMKCYVCQPAHPSFVFAGQALLLAVLLELCRRPGHTACCAAEPL